METAAPWRSSSEKTSPKRKGSMLVQLFTLGLRSMHFLCPVEKCR
jgi:hypothetical protein